MSTTLILCLGLAALFIAQHWQQIKKDDLIETEGGRISWAQKNCFQERGWPDCILPVRRQQQGRE